MSEAVRALTTAVDDPRPHDWQTHVEMDNRGRNKLTVIAVCVRCGQVRSSTVDKEHINLAGICR